MYNIDGYEMHSKLRKNRKGGGIIIYARDGYVFTPMNYSLIHCECIIGQITTPHNYHAYICAIYRPPSESKHLFVKEISNILSNSSIKSCDTYLLGDVNIDLKTYDTIREYYVSSMSECGLTSAISDYTRIETRGNNTTRSCIDHIFTRTRSLDLYSAALGTVMADHRMLVLSCVGFDPTQIQVDTKTIQKIDSVKMKSLLNNVNWNEIDDIECTNEIYDYIIKQFNKCYEESKYFKKINVNSKRNKQPWINNKINNMCKKKDLLFIKWKNDSTNKILRLEYNKLRNRTHKIIEKSRNKHYLNEINDNKMNPRKLWQILNNLAGRNKKSVDEVILRAFKNNNVEIKTIADKFALEFRNSVKKILPKCNRRLLNESDYMFPNNTSMNFRKATNNSVGKLIRNLDTKKAPGVDNIRCIDIKSICDKMSGAIVKLINSSVKQGKYPEVLKTGIVRPIHKKGSFADYGNYRPITILPVIDKIVEKYVCNQIQDFYAKNDVLSSTQYGFQPNKSTTQLLSKFTDEVNEALNDKNNVILLFIDFSKAFDTLRHDTLLTKLDNSGVRGPILKWCENYLMDRKYNVKICNEYSDAIDVTEGTAQGSVLGPLHYLTYVNDMENVVNHCSVYQYADDTCLVASHRDVKVAAQWLQEDFTQVSKWAHDAGLVLNASKTKIIHVHSSHLNNKTTFKIIAHSHSCLHSTLSGICQCEAIDQVTHHTYLGLVVDDRFSWTFHVDSVCDKLRAVLAKFYILKSKVPFKILLSMYNALAESIIAYGITSYGRTFKSYTEKISKLQVRLLKLIVPRKIKHQFKDNVIELFKYCKVLPIQIKLNMSLLIEQYNNKNIQIPISHKTITRNITKNKLIVPKVRNYYGRRTLKFLIPTLLNEIPKSIKTEINSKNYKQKFKKYFYNHLRVLI